MENKPMLTIKEMANLEMVSYDAIFKRIKRKTLKAIKYEDGTYRINLSDLSEKAQLKYYNEHKEELADIAEFKNKYENSQSDKLKAKEAELRRLSDKSLDSLSEKQRKEIDFWINVIEEREKYIDGCGRSKTEKTKEFIELFNRENRVKITYATFTRKYGKFKSFGVIGLSDGRKDAKPIKVNIEPFVWNIFQRLWLDQNKPSISYCRELVEQYLLQKDLTQYLPLKSVSTFNRATDKIPVGVKTMMREGDKAYTDKFETHITRNPEMLYSNQMWTSDYHTLDFFVKDDVTGEYHRPHLVVWQDIRSRKILSWDLRISSDSHGVTSTFRKAVKKYGIPTNVVLDNGREYLTHAFGGTGKRRASKSANYGTPLLDRLGIRMVNAQVRNGRAKVVERTFRTVADQFSRFFITYTGNKPHTRPERHGNIMKDDDKLPLLSEVKEAISKYIQGIYNTHHSKAKGLNGKSPNSTYADNLIIKKTATEEQLNQLLLRSANSRKVERNGVKLKILGKEFEFFSAELVHNYIGHKVFVRYNEDDLSKVRVYDEKEVFICEAERLEYGGYGLEDDTEGIKKNKKLKRQLKKMQTDYIEEVNENTKDVDGLDIMDKWASKEIEDDDTSYEAKVIEPFNFKGIEETGIRKKAVGDDIEIDFNRMTKNSAKNKKKGL